MRHVIMIGDDLAALGRDIGEHFAGLGFKVGELFPESRSVGL